MLDALVDLVLPRACAGCALPGRGLCRDCRLLLAGPAVGWVRPDPCPAGMPALTALLTYQGPVRGLLLCHKERGRLGLTRPLGGGLATAVAVHGLEEVVLCPVPSSPQAVRARGQDHAWRLAAAAASALRARGVPATAARLLRPARRVADQAGLTSAERAANLHGALLASGPPRRRVVVIDDVVTTGATLVEAARALAAAGHDVRGAAVVAATSRRRASPVQVPPLLPEAEGR